MEAAEPRPPHGWLRTLREALGMTRAQLGARVGLSESAINKLEANEARDAITLANLQKLAAGMGGRVVYAIVPNEAPSFEAFATKQAESIARKRLARVSHTMALEDQSVRPGHEQRQLRQIVDSLLKGSRRNLWR